MGDPRAVKKESIVKQTDWDRLLAEIKLARSTVAYTKSAERNSPLNVQHRRDIVKSIASVYFFLRRELQMPDWPLTPGEFFEAKQAIYNVAEKESGSIRAFLRRILKKKNKWDYFLRHGNFDIKTTPFGDWYMKHPWTFAAWSRFDPDSFKKLAEPQYYAIPPNIDELTQDVFDLLQIGCGGRLFPP